MERTNNMAKKTKSSATTVRSYNVGLGDCFLLSFDDDGTRRHMLFDFGTAPGQTMHSFASIAEDIVEVTNNKIDVIVVSSDHHDHLNGFLNQKKAFGNIDVDHVWMAASSDPQCAGEDSIKTIAKSREQAATFLAAEHDNDLAASFKTVVESNVPTTMHLEFVRKLAKKGVTYLSNESGLKNSPFGQDIKIEVLGPFNEPSNYFTTDDDYPEFQELGKIVERLDFGFNPAKCRKHPLLTSRAYKNTTCIEEPVNLAGRDWKSLQKRNQVFGVSEMRSIDSVINDLSLVLLITIKGKKLLFPGDAGANSWYWLEDIINESTGNGSIDFLKVAQHGCQVGTPDYLHKKLGKTAKVMISTKKNVYGPSNSIPDAGLLKKLKDKHGKNLIVTDPDKLWVEATI